MVLDGEIVWMREASLAKSRLFGIHEGSSLKASNRSLAAPATEALSISLHCLKKGATVNG